MKRGLPPLLAVLAVWPGTACETSTASFADGGTASVPSDAADPSSDTPVSLAVDFAVENCPSFDPVALTCTGHVPLATRFVPLATTTVTKYWWDFGDGSFSDSEATPNHVYVMPGVYTVTIIATGVGGGVVTKVHAGFIVAQANVAGQACDMNAQCKLGLTCVCGADAPCTAGLARGMCASTCPSGLCGAGQVCAGLQTATPPADPQPWQTNLCLVTCSGDADCAPGLRCRTLPPGPSGIAQVHGCFSPVPADIGEPCRDADGKLRGDLCVTGACADLGSLGMCTMSCQQDTSCPLGSACAVLGDGRRLCLRSCTSFACDNDSLLTCIGPNPGDLGYELASPDAGSSYCAPKFCTTDTEDACLPAGRCAAEAGSGHCVRR